MSRLILIAASALAACGGAPSADEGTTATSDPEPTYTVGTGDVAAALAGDHRAEDERARDRYRHPTETLAFFGLEPTMTVVELWPGPSAWYTKVLAPVLRDHGTLVTATLDPSDESWRGRFGRDFRALMASHPEVYDQVGITVLFPTDYMSDVEDGSVDMVLSFRSAHNWIRWDGHEPEPYFEAIARVLRPGGVFGIVQHRAPEGMEHGTDGTTGYLTEAHIVGLAEAVGLTLDARSQLNENPADTHEHPDGVWSLPPVMRGGEDEALRAVGESDRMTLRFTKAAGEPEP